MFLIAFLSTQKTLGSKAQIKVVVSNLAKTTALAAIVALPLAAVDYALTYLCPINPTTRLILEGTPFLTIYTILLEALQDR